MNMCTKSDILTTTKTPRENQRRNKCEKCTLRCRIYRAILRRLAPSILKKFCFLEWHKEQEREHRERRKNNPHIRVQFIWEKPEFHLWYYLRHPHDYLLWLSFGNRVRKHWLKINRGMKRAEKERAKRRRSGTGTTVNVNILHASLYIPEGVNLYPDGEELRDISKRIDLLNEHFR